MSKVNFDRGCRLLSSISQIGLHQLQNDTTEQIDDLVIDLLGQCYEEDAKHEVWTRESLDKKARASLIDIITEHNIPFGHISDMDAAQVKSAAIDAIMKFQNPTD